MAFSLTYELPYEVNGKAVEKSFLFISEVYDKMTGIRLLFIYEVNEIRQRQAVIYLADKNNRNPR